MKDKSMKLFGLFMTLALLAGLAGVSAISTGGVSSAATSSLEWAPISVPDETHMQLYPGSDIGPMAVAPDDGTLFVSIVVDGDWSMLKSTDGGYTWRETGLSDILAASSDDTAVVAVELSPLWGTDSTIYVATTSGVYKSKDRGNTFTALSMTGVSEIASLDTGKDEDGKVKLAVGTDADVYLFDDGVWTAQSIGSYSVLAVAFSPNYATDEVIVAVVNNGSQTLVRTKYGTAGWGEGINDVTITVADSYKACIGLPGDYSPTTPNFFVGLSAPSNSGDLFSIAWRVSSFTVTDLNVSANGSSSNVNIWSMAVSGSFAQAVIVAGAEVPTSESYGSMLVFASADGGRSWVPNTTDVVNKQPTGETRATVVKTASAAYVGTCGNQSAVSVALTGGYTSWNQRGLIDTSIDVITDMVVSEEYFSDSTMYITTNNTSTGDTSLWRTTTGGGEWERVFCSTLAVSTATCAFDMVRLGADTVVVIQSGTKLIWLSTNGGTTFSNKRGTTTIGALLTEGVTAFALSNSSTFYAGGANCTMSQSGDYGVRWTVNSNSDLLPSEAVVDVVLQDSVIYIGTNQGRAFVGNESSFDFFQIVDDNPGATGDIVKVAPDPYEGDYIYTGITGSAGTRGIWRCYLGDEESEWEQIADDAAVGNVSSLVCAEDNGILYAISSTHGIGYRCVRPTSVKEEPVFAPISNGLDLVAGEKVKTGLRVISGSNLLFVIGQSGDSDSYDRIWTSSDEIIKMRLIAPANGAVVGDMPVNSSDVGNARVSFWWKGISGADSYEVQIARDSDFITVLDASCFESGLATTTNNMTLARLWLGNTYYWRVRVTAPYMSQWSENWSFFTPLGPALSLPELLSPAPGKTGVNLQPVLQWNNSVAASNYELVLTESCDPNKSVLNLTGDKKLGPVTAYQLPSDLQLKPNTTYCWKVRGLSDLSNSEWSDTGTFMTKAMEVAVVDEAGTPVWVWIIIGVSAILIVGVVVLIIRTRQPI